MLLAIDVGNTNTVFGVHDGDKWVVQWRSATDARKTADDHAAWLWRLADMHGMDLGKINGCVISTVVPQAVFNFRNLARRYLNVEPMFIGDPSLKSGVEIRIHRPEQVGADRIVSALGAHVAIQRPARVIGQDTISAMQSGVFWGYIDLIDGLVRRIKAEYGKPLQVVATGGVASLFEGASETIDHYDPDILITGLLEIYKRNK